MHKRKRIKFLIFLFFCALTILLAEFSLRILFDGMLEHKIVKISNDTTLGYELIPDAETTYWGFMHKITPTTIKISGQGLRDRFYTLNKPNDVTRIAFLGDSYVFGLGINSEDTIPKQVEFLLNCNPIFSHRYSWVRLIDYSYNRIFLLNCN